MVLAFFVGICALGGAAILGLVSLWVDKTEKDLERPAITPRVSPSGLERAGALMLITVPFQLGVLGVSDYPSQNLILLALLVIAVGIVAMSDRARRTVTAILGLIVLSNVIILFRGLLSIRELAAGQLAFAPFSFSTLFLLSIALLMVMKKKEQLAKTESASTSASR